MSEMPPTPPSPGIDQASPMKPHRGAVVLVLGILGIVLFCFILGIVAWVMGKNDLEEMRAGQMDPSGEGLTKAGKICGMISVILTVVFVALWLLLAMCGIIAGGAAAMNGY